MAVFQLGGKEVQVDPWKTSWPWSYVKKQQGVEVKVNPSSHWWCLWLCDSTDDVDAITCTARLTSALEEGTTIEGKCSSCGDLTVKSGASWGFSAPWLYQGAEFTGTVEIDAKVYGFEGQLLYS